MKPAVTTKGGDVIWFDSRILSTIGSQFFDPAWQHAEGQLLGSAPGRGRALFLRSEGHDLVLRPFRRGGLFGKINADRYLRLGGTQSRAYMEYQLLDWMRHHDLPVPRPVAARYAPAGLCYRADLITERIPDARPLADILRETALTPDIWSAIGAVIRRMHDLGVDHSDLNCRNILLDPQMKVWLIDFDKCRRRKPGAWQSGNLARLIRSLAKERAKQPGLFWSDTDCSALLAGYGAVQGADSNA